MQKQEFGEQTPPLETKLSSELGGYEYNNNNNNNNDDDDDEDEQRENINRQEEQQQATKQQQQQQQLNRRLSAPSRLKLLKSKGEQQQREISDQTTTPVALTTANSTPLLNRCHSDGCQRCSSFDQRYSSLRAHQKHHRHGCKLSASSSSPLSSNASTASDSAFSRSQSTLGSDSSQRCSFKSDVKKGCSSGGDGGGKDSKSLSKENPDLPDGDHFKIVWQNLSYQVPEKKLAKAVASVGRVSEHLLSYKQKLLLSRGNKEISCNVSSDAVSSDASNQTAFRDLEGGILANGQKNDAIKTKTTTTTSEEQKQRQVIFSNLNGCVQSGQLTAILGPSGAGKTTFLKCLTSSVVQGVSGRLSIVGGPKTSHHLKLCIIPQKDYLFDNLTVMENLLFASRIKNTKRDFNHKDNVYHVANLLGLNACLKLKTSRLSGGQYKRVSIAQELLSQPDILILDEPTSGLDSLTCFRTVSVLKELVDLSRKGLMLPLAIVMTIHQPQIKIFNLFHHVYILSSMGNCVYEGRPGHLVDMVAEQCKLLPPPDDQNPASFIIDLASGVYGQEPQDQLVRMQRENFTYLHKDQALESHQHEETNNLQQDGTTTTNKLLMIDNRLKKRNDNDHQSFWLHTNLLIKRLWISMWRDSLLTTTRVLFHIIIPFVFYFVYSQKSGIANACPHVERELDIHEMVSDTNIQRLATQHDELILSFENVSLFFLLLYSFSMCVLAVTALSFPLNMQILLKETSNGWYTMPRFVMAKTLADLPIELTMPIISISIAYVITGQPSSYLCWRMLTVTAIMTICSLISQTQGLLFGAYFMNNVQAAVFVSQASTLPWIMLSGFTTRVSELPRILQWLSFGSIYRLGIESIVAVRYGFGMCPCQNEMVDNTPARLVGIPEQLRSVMRYYMDSYSSLTNETLDSSATNVTSSSSSTTTTVTKDIVAAAAATTKQTTDSAAASVSGDSDIFAKIATTLSRANTYGVDIGSCKDVKPFIMSAREVDESTLPHFVLILMAILIFLKILLFFVVRIRTR